MLADDLALAPTRMLSLVPAQRVSYMALSRLVQSAPRYVLDRAAVFFVQQTAEMHPSKILTALPICRMPFPRMFIEFAYRHRTDWIEQAKASGVIGNINGNPDASPPSRLGYYLERQDHAGRIIEVTPVWVHANIANKNDRLMQFADRDAVSICCMSQQINLTEDLQTDPEALNAAREEIKATLTDRSRYYYSQSMKTPEGQTAWALLDARIKLTIPEFMTPFWSFVMKETPNLTPKLVKAAEYDLLAEWRFVIALLLAMNSRNIFSVGDEVDFERLNKNRAASGKPALLSHREVKLSMSRIQRNRMGGGLGDSREIARHDVQGHWKVRRTGLFYWNDHQRGNVGEASAPVMRVTA